jgi:hypothetical protein
LLATLRTTGVIDSPSAFARSIAAQEINLTATVIGIKPDTHVLATWCCAAGAMEAGMGLQGRVAKQKVNQTEKELLAMSFYNSLRGAHHDVWVVLTDGTCFARFHYTSHNTPAYSPTRNLYTQGMACDQVYGELK